MVLTLLLLRRFTSFPQRPTFRLWNSGPWDYCRFKAIIFNVIQTALQPTHTHTHFTPIVVYPTSDTNNKVMYILFDVRDVRVRVVVIVYVADDDDVSKTHGEASVCDYTSRVVSKRRAAGNRRRGRTYETYIAVCKACANLSVCVCVAVYISRCCSVYLFKSRHKHSIYK